MTSFAKDTIDFFKQHIVILSAIGIALSLVICWQYHSSHQKPSDVKPAVSVSVAPVIVQNIENSLELVGSVYPSATVSIKPRIDSEIVKINFQDGDTVEEGKILFELDNRILKSQLSQQQAVLERNQAELERATLKFERDQKLLKKGFSSPEQLDTSRQTAKAATANVQADQALISSINTQLDYTLIRAPISGRVGTINLSVGNVVKAVNDQPLVIINKIIPIKIQAAIPQDYYDIVRTALKKGPVKILAFNSKGQELEGGTLQYRENIIDEQTRTLAIHGVFENREEKLWPGMFVNVNVIIGIDENVLTVPITAVQNGQEGQYLFIVNEGKAYKKKIKTIRIQNEIAIIEGDIKAGEQVIIDGILSVKEGNSVSVHPEASFLSGKEEQKASFPLQKA